MQGGHAHGRHGRQLQESANAAVGLTAMVTAAVCTSFASVYFEKMLKGARKPSLWLRNIQLASYSAAIATVTVLFEEDPLRATEGWLHGFNSITWGVVSLNVAGGLLVAVTIKYADNIIRGFAQAVAIIFGALGSYFIFDFHITPSFLVGVVLVIFAILFYGGALSPSELCETIAGACMPKTAPMRPAEMSSMDAEQPLCKRSCACEASPLIKNPAAEAAAEDLSDEGAVQSREGHRNL